MGSLNENSLIFPLPFDNDAENNPDISVTLVVSQFNILPYLISAFVLFRDHSVKALLKVSLLNLLPTE